MSGKRMQKDKIDQVLKTLTFREREIIKLRYGLYDNNGYVYSHEAVARIFKTTRMCVGKIEKKAIRKLQHPSRSRELEGFLDTPAAENPTTPEGWLWQRVFGVPAGRPPSFFDYATSERCQDAFISWLITWAEHDHRKTNGPLHRTGVFFLKRLLSLHGIKPPPKYTGLRIVKYKGIDILVKDVVNRIVVLIEDKIDFSEQPGRLERYLRIVRKDFEELRPVPVYLKTGDHQDLSSIAKAGWKCFLRRDMLKVLDYGKRQGVESDIFRDFHSRLRQMEARHPSVLTEDEIIKLTEGTVIKDQPD